MAQVDQIGANYRGLVAAVEPHERDHAGTTRASGEGERAELAKEGLTMALYVSVCLLAATAVVAESADRTDVEAVGLVWGTTLGLSLAHLFAFRLSARLIGAGSVHEHDARIAFAQLAGAVAVAVVCTAPVLLLSSTAQLDVVRLLLAALIALVAWFTARSAGRSRVASLVYALIMLAVASTIAVLKNVLSGH
jgi:hypothetical protein